MQTGSLRFLRPVYSSHHIKVLSNVDFLFFFIIIFLTGKIFIFSSDVMLPPYRKLNVMTTKKNIARRGPFIENPFAEKKREIRMESKQCQRNLRRYFGFIWCLRLLNEGSLTSNKDITQTLNHSRGMVAGPAR